MIGVTEEHHSLYAMKNPTPYGYAMPSAILPSPASSKIC